MAKKKARRAESTKCRICGDQVPLYLLAIHLAQEHAVGEPAVEKTPLSGGIPKPTTAQTGKSNPEKTDRPSSEATSRQSEPPLKPAEAEVVVERIRVPASLLGVVHGRKHLRGGNWILTTKSGVTIGDFPSEAELDNWWLTFQSSQGRPAKPCVEQEASHGWIYLPPEAKVAPKAKTPPEVDVAREAMRTQQHHGNATPKASSSPLPTACKAPPNRAIGIAIFNQSRKGRPVEPDPQQTKASPTRSTPLPTAGKPTPSGGTHKPISITREKGKPAKNDHIQTQLQHHLNELSKRKLKLVKAVERVEAEQSRTGHVALDTTAPVDPFAAASDACRDYWTLLREIIDLLRSLPPSPLKQKLIDAQQAVQPDTGQPSHNTRKKRKKRKKSGARPAWMLPAQGQTLKKGSHRSSS